MAMVMAAVEKDQAFAAFSEALVPRMAQVYAEGKSLGLNNFEVSFALRAAQVKALACPHCKLTSPEDVAGIDNK
jgi:hypothetical protein